MDDTKTLVAPTPVSAVIKLGKLDTYVKTVHPSLVLDEVVKRELAEYLDSFTNEVIDRAYRLATNRARSCGAYRIAANDVELVLDTMDISHTPRVEALLRQRQTPGSNTCSLLSSAVISLPPPQREENFASLFVEDSLNLYGGQQHCSNLRGKWIKVKLNATAEYLKCFMYSAVVCSLECLLVYMIVLQSIERRAVPKSRVLLASEWSLSGTTKDTSHSPIFDE